MQYDFSMGSGGAQFIDVAGSFFKYKSGLGAIRVRNSKGGYIDLLPGQGLSGLDFSSLSVTDISGAANKGVLLAGAYEFRDDRIAGTVDVVDGGKVRTIAGQAYSGAVGMSAPAAGMYGQVQLWNPAASGKRLVLESVAISAGANMTCNLVKAIAAIGGVSVGSSQSKNMSRGADSAGLIRIDTTITTVGPAPIIQQLAAQAGIITPFVPREPYVIEPGFGLVIWANTAAMVFAANLEWFEESL